MENYEHVSSEELSEWEQIQSPFSSTIKSSVFPPGNHEDFPISSTAEDNNNQQLQEPKSPIKSVVSSTSGGSDDGGVKRWKRHLGVLLNRISCGVKDYYAAATSSKVGFLSFASTGLLLVSLIWWQRRKESLMLLLIKEKDMKINQLLLQINEILLPRRRIQVIRMCEPSLNCGIVQRHLVEDLSPPSTVTAATRTHRTLCIASGRSS
ncbi:hypothetical protein ACJIZ3_025144 [Penstemon smallii]|uniref:Transmembrane protein n=1 Tax=Penstemon smallii TaxID=265156 RepID=A0ABD3TWD6_9LAMI